jgi:outer membrane protein assembly factor BamB
VVYVGSWDHNVCALNAESGVRLWSYTTGSPAVANGVVYVGSVGGKVYSFGLK